MKNILVVTLGTRDVQLKNEITSVSGFETNCPTYPNRTSSTLFISSNRDGSKHILDNFNKYKNFLLFPIIKPAIEYTLEQVEKIDQLIIVCTDQSKIDGIENRFKNNDTIESASLLDKILRDQYSNQKILKIKKLVVTENVIYHDAMYDFFDQKFKSYLKFSEDDNVFLFGQGGIDAINTTLLLKCIEYNPNTVQLNKPENSDIAFPLQFPKKFVQNFKKQKVIHALDNFNYSAIIDVNYNKVITEFAKYALARASFDFDKSIQYLRNLMTIDTTHRPFFNNHITQLKLTEGNFRNRQKEMYLSAKMTLHHESYADFLVKMFTIAEGILKPEVEQFLQGKIVFNPNNKHKIWNNLINAKPTLKTYLDTCTINESPLKYNAPNRATFKAIYDFINQNSAIESNHEIENLLEALEQLSLFRNKVAHELRKVSREDIDKKLNTTCGITLDDFTANADNFFGISGMDVYVKINNKMKEML